MPLCAYMPARLRPGLILAALLPALLLSACSRDGEAGMRAQLDQWFAITDAVYFHSRRTCTVAMYRIDPLHPGPKLAVQSEIAAARADFAANGVAALRIAHRSPNDMTDALLLSADGALGKEVLHAGALVKPCLDDAKTKAALFRAMTLPGAVLAYDSRTQGAMILDEGRLELFFIAGDVW